MHDDSPLVSICIPTYNRASSVLQAVRSALAQTYLNLEVIVSDDASLDDTCVLLNRIEDPRLVVRRNARRLGQVANRNRNLQLARGELIKFLDSDDSLDPSCVRDMSMALVDHPSVGLAFCRRRLVIDRRPTPDVNRWIQTYRNLHHAFGDLSPTNEGRKLLETWLTAAASSSANWTRANWIGEPTAVMVRRRVLEACGGFDERTRLAPDIGLWLRVMARSDVAFIDAELVNYRVNTGSSTSESEAASSGRRSWLERLWTLEALAADPKVTNTFPALLPVLAGARREAFRTVTKLGRGAEGRRYPISPYGRYLAARSGTLLGRSLAVPLLGPAAGA